MKRKEENKMFDQLQNMMATPQAREMVFKMIAQQVAQAPPERREALSRVTVTLERTVRDMHLEVGHSDDEQIEEIIKQAINNWTDMLSRGFQSMGFKVEIVE
jgi:thioesterase domain-containing protein